MKHFKIVAEKHPDIYVAYPLGMKGVVVGQGDAYEAALADVKSAIHFISKHSAPLTIPNQRAIKSSTLRTILTQSGVSREDFLAAYY